MTINMIVYLSKFSFNFVLCILKLQMHSNWFKIVTISYWIDHPCESFFFNIINVFLNFCISKFSFYLSFIGVCTLPFMYFHF